MLHVYGQEYWHCDARIIGTREDLARLRNQITDALKAPSVGQYFQADGEAYDLKIATLGEAEMQKLPHAYEDESCGGWTKQETDFMEGLHREVSNAT